MYCIRNTSNPNLAWSNEEGWVSTETYDLFTESERATLNLPIGGYWWRVE